MSRVWRSFSTRSTALGSIVLALASMDVAGCGGKGERLKPVTSSTEDAGVTVDPCNLTATLEIQNFGCTPGSTAKCADFEGYPAGTGALPTGWFRYVDKVADAAYNLPDASIAKPVFIDPTGSDSYARMTAEDKHCGTGTVAYHLLAENQAVWGPQFGIKFTGFSDGPLPPINLDTFAGKQWEGLGFWIKKGNDHPELEPTGTSVFVGVSDPNTISNQTGKDSDPPCNDASNIDSKKCDAYGAGVGFDTNWRYVMIPFDDLKQRGYGVRVDSLDRTKIMQIKFAMDIGDGANGNWNVWVDDIMLYRWLNSPKDGG